MRLLIISVLLDDSATGGIGTVATDAKLTVEGDVKVSGVITATSFDGSFTGNADSASQLETTRTISLGGDLSGLPHSMVLVMLQSQVQSEQIQLIWVQIQ